MAIFSLSQRHSGAKIGDNKVDYLPVLNGWDSCFKQLVNSKEQHTIIVVAPECMVAGDAELFHSVEPLEALVETLTRLTDYVLDNLDTVKLVDVGFSQSLNHVAHYLNLESGKNAQTATYSVRTQLKGLAQILHYEELHVAYEELVAACTEVEQRDVVDPVKRLSRLIEQSTQEATQTQQAEQENELLLLQLQQVQEELEAQHQLNSEQAQIAKQREAELEKNKQTVQEQLEAQQEECDLLLLQLQQVQEELEHVFAQAKAKTDCLTDRASSVQTLEQRLEKVEGEYQASLQQLEQLQSKLIELQDRKVAEVEEGVGESHNDELDEIKQENELLLLQLQQVQEELEHYFVHAKALEKEIEALNKTPQIDTMDHELATLIRLRAVL
ncbi:hypothetical protein [Idiomarina sp.]|uniref:hypothetical protein n=1 Tax=Idiomarina sp. TaxID=1874361 RepID=UPI0025B929E7|nr:hypothetical protein [Idiomarina sp.]NQZ03472.1 hypothetical protein [Idiomarina sp.]